MRSKTRVRAVSASTGGMVAALLFFAAAAPAATVKPRAGEYNAYDAKGAVLLRVSAPRTIPKRPRGTVLRDDSARRWRLRPGGKAPVITSYADSAFETFCGSGEDGFGGEGSRGGAVFITPKGDFRGLTLVGSGRLGRGASLGLFVSGKFRADGTFSVTLAPKRGTCARTLSGRFGLPDDRIATGPWTGSLSNGQPVSLNVSYRVGYRITDFVTFGASPGLCADVPDFVKGSPTDHSILRNGPVGTEGRILAERNPASTYPTGAFITRDRLEGSLQPGQDSSSGSPRCLPSFTASPGG